MRKNLVTVSALSSIIHSISIRIKLLLEPGNEDIAKYKSGSKIVRN
jgi:hypothetical protein